MSGLPRLADILRGHRHVSKVPYRTHGPQQFAYLFGHLVGSRLSPASRGAISWGGWRAEIFASTTAGLPATHNGGFSVHLSAGITSGLASFAHPVYLTPSCFDQRICPRSKSLVLEFPRSYSSLVG